MSEIKIPNLSHTCFLCQRVALERCNLCESDVWFCSPEHRKMHSESELSCRPFTIVHKEGIGRCMVASRKILKGETIYEEEALVVGPSPLCSPQCLLCRQKVPLPSLHPCPTCSYPMCSPNCSNLHPTSPECSILSRLAPEQQQQQQSYEIILPLRMLLLLSNSETAEASLAASLMDHAEARENDLEHWKRLQEEVVTPLHKACHDTFTVPEVNRSVGVVEVNNFEIYNPGTCGFRGVYPLTSLLSHSCLPNTRLVMSRSGPLCPNRCLAAVDIERGEEVTVSYVHLHMSSSFRRRRLKENWYFDCACERCRDRTECGTYLDAVRCFGCKQGFLLPKDPLDYESVWVCDGCGEKVQSERCRTLAEDLLEKKDSLDRSDLRGYLDLHDLCLDGLHENHYVVNAIRRWLVPLLCRLKMNNNNNKDKEDEERLMERKVDMCRKYLDVLDVVEKGLTKNRGRILYELSDTVLTLQNRRYQRRELSEVQMIQDLLNCELLAQEAISCLVYDEERTFERYVHDSSKSLCESIVRFREFLGRKDTPSLN